MTAGERECATDTLSQTYPFLGNKPTPRRYGPREATRVFIRDGFIDRYSGSRVVFPPVLRVISVMLPEAFPYHPNWKMEVTHPAYWELTATVDHLEAASRGGADDESNWVTTSMARNSAKGNHSLEDLGWSLHPAGDLDEWDGLLSWYLAITGSNPELIVDASMKRWRQAAIEVATREDTWAKAQGEVSGARCRLLVGWRCGDAMGANIEVAAGATLLSEGAQ